MPGARAVTVYDRIGVPFAEASVQPTDTLRSPGVAVIDNGAPGTAGAVTDALGAGLAPAPFSFVAIATKL